MPMACQMSRMASDDGNKFSIEGCLHRQDQRRGKDRQTSTENELWE